MTDNEFIKALEDYIKENEFEYFHSNMMSEYSLIKKSLNLITRQQAENDDLSYKLTGVMHSVDKWLDGDELKQDEVNRAATMREKTLRLIETAKAESIKEFADRLKQEWFNNYYDSPDVNFDEFVDNLLKEMVGEE